MHMWKGTAITAALLGAVSTGSAFLPAVHAQAAAARAPRALEILAGRGSQIGVTVRDVDEAAGTVDHPVGPHPPAGQHERRPGLDDGERAVLAPVPAPAFVVVGRGVDHA